MSTSIALGYLDENSIIKNADFKRYNLKFNNIFDVSEKVKVTTSILAIHSLRNRMPSTVSHAFVLSPLGTPYDEEGNLKLFVNPSEALATNPLAEVANNRDEEKTYGIIGNASLEWEITDGLFYNFMAGADYSSLRRGQFIGSETAARAGGPHQSNLRNTGVISTIVNNLVSYRKTFNNIHRLDAMAGFTTETYRLESAFVNGTDMDYEGLWYNMGAAATIIDKGSQLREWGIMSLMTRLNYTLNDRYIMTFTYRQDGSSRLAEGNKWAGFPSAALGWRISEENFLQASSIVDNLKLRLSWGRTGNTNVDPYETLGRLGMTFYDWDGAPAIGYNPTQIPNPDLRWETTTERNLGLDFGFFEGRINGAIDVYNRLTEDLMLSRNLPITSGFNSITQNIGSVRNTGFELMLAGDVLKVNDFTWNLGITFARNKNEIVDLYGDKKDDTGSEWFIGQPIRVDYRTNFIGIWSAGEESEAAKYNAEPGFPKIQDIANEDDADPKINDLDRVVIPLDPNWLGGINTAFTYRNFNLNLIFNIRQGAKGYNRFQEMDDRLNGRWNRINTGYWKADNPNNDNPMPTIDQDSQLNLNDSDYWIDDLSFVRLSNINFGYQFPNTFAQSIGLKGLRTYFNVRNPIIWTNYIGMDPETGTDNREHPTLISYQLGLNVNF
jgi:TonB-linked SusC/RagA family outer membrane protein